MMIINTILLIHLLFQSKEVKNTYLKTKYFNHDLYCLQYNTLIQLYKALMKSNFALKLNMTFNEDLRLI